MTYQELQSSFEQLQKDFDDYKTSMQPLIDYYNLIKAVGVLHAPTQNDLGEIQKAIIDRQDNGATTRTIALSGLAQNISVPVDPSGYLVVRWMNQTFRIPFVNA